LNSDPPDLCSWIVRITDINHQPLAHCVLFKVGIVLGESRLEAKFSSAFLNSQKHKWFFFFIPVSLYTLGRNQLNFSYQSEGSGRMH
jgi:hypothetical protein